MSMVYEFGLLISFFYRFVLIHRTKYQWMKGNSFFKKSVCFIYRKEPKFKYQYSFQVYLILSRINICSID